MSVPFELLAPGAAPPADDERQRRGQFLDQRPIPPALNDHWVAAPRFQPSPELVVAVNVALAVGAPLLLTGEAGTGKTQVAFYLAWYFAVPPERFFTLDVRSTTTAADLLYSFDSVAYFHAAQQPGQQGKPLDRGTFVRPGPLWRALESPRTSILLIDEVDKAPRDFPNDLLGVLERHGFKVPEQNDRPIRRLGAPPVVVITSNSERRLPEPFLRRCVFHHLYLTPELLKQAALARRQDFPKIDDAALDAALVRLWDLRQLGLRKVPGTAEFLVWLTALSLQGGVGVRALAERPLRDLPCLPALVKDREDLTLVQGGGA